jgi:hypothetical protein
MKTILATALVAGIAASASAQISATAFYSGNVRGDFSAAGSGTRGSGSSTFNLAGVGGGVVRAFAVWNFLSNNALGTSGEATITVNNTRVNAFQGYRGTPDLCWGLNGINTYVADVTGIITGNGAITVFGADDGAGRLGEGVSIVAVWDDGVSASRTVDLFHGVANNTNAGGGFSTINFSGAYGGGSLNFLTNALDGQQAGDIFRINGTNVGGILPGTGNAGDAALGQLGGLYDHFAGDVSPWVAANSAGMNFGTDNLFSDCIGHTFAGVSYIPTPGALGLLGLGGLIAGRRRR